MVADRRAGALAAGLQLGCAVRPGFALAFAGVLILVALDPWAWALPLLFTLAGLTMTAANVSANAFLQVAAPVALRGRSVSLYLIAMRGGLSIGSLATGASIHALGIRQALMLNGALALAFHAAIALIWSRSAKASIDAGTLPRMP